MFVYSLLNVGEDLKVFCSFISSLAEKFQRYKFPFKFKPLKETPHPEPEVKIKIIESFLKFY